MMFSSGMFLAAGVTIAIVTIEKVLDAFGWYWFGFVMKMAIPLAGMALGVYFLQHNPLLHWIGL